MDKSICVAAFFYINLVRRYVDMKKQNKNWQAEGQHVYFNIIDVEQTT